MTISVVALRSSTVTAGCYFPFSEYRRLNKVVAGKRDWLFYELGRKDFDPNRLLILAELTRWKEHLEAKYHWLREQGIAYVFMIAPDKHSIYGGYLPSRLAAKLLSPSLYDQLVDYVKSNSNVPILDLRSALLEAKKTCKLIAK